MPFGPSKFLTFSDGCGAIAREVERRAMRHPLAVLTGVFAAAVASSPALAAPKVLICQASQSGAASLQASLVASGLFAAVDVTNCESTTPTLATLQQYQAVLVWDDFWYGHAFQNRATLGDNLASYVDSGGGVVTMMWAMYSSPPYGLSGRWETATYGCLMSSPGYVLGGSGSVSLTAAPSDPANPLVAGINSVTTTGGRTIGALNSARGATTPWSWSDGRPAICQATVSPGRSLALNLQYGSMSTGDVDRMVRNALIVAAGGVGPFTPNPVSVTFPDTGTGATTPPTVITFTNTATSTATATSFTLTGTNPGDFTVTAAPTPPISIAPQGTFSVSVAFAPTAGGARSATLQVVVTGQTATDDVPLAGNGIAPRIVVTPNPVTLGTTAIGVPVSVSAAIANQGGSVAVTAASITFDAAEFSLGAGPSYPVSLPQGASFMQTITFTPTVTGLRNGELTLNTNDPANPTIKVPLQGTAGPPAITLDTGSVAFGTTNVGATSPATQVTISNTGFSALTVSSIILSGMNPNDFVLNPMGFPATLGVGGSGKFSVSFAPTASGSRSGTVIITSNDPSNPTKTVSMFGSATLAAIGLSPVSLDLGKARVGSGVGPANVTISNTGTGTLHVVSWALSGADAAAFALGGATPPVNLTSAMGAMATVSCTPPRLGALSARLDFSTDIGVQSVPLTCTGVAPTISVMPAALDFGPVPVGLGSMPQPVTVTNTGTDDLHISQLGLAGATAADFSLAGMTAMATVAPGGSIRFTVTLTPAAPGAESAEVDIANDDANTPVAKVALSGSGVSVGLGAMPSSVDFGTVAVLTSAPKVITLTSTGTGTALITGLALSGTGAARFSTTQATPFSIAAGLTAQVTVVYAPTSVTTDDATLTLTATGSSPLDVPLHGVGVPMDVDAGPQPDAGAQDAGLGDAGPDGGGEDAGFSNDAGPLADAGAGNDGGAPDAGERDAGASDAGGPTADAGLGGGAGGCGCNSGAQGLLAAALLVLVRRRQAAFRRGR
jgi:hypothetical protein